MTVLWNVMTIYMIIKFIFIWNITIYFNDLFVVTAESIASLKLQSPQINPELGLLSVQRFLFFYHQHVSSLFPKNMAVGELVTQIVHKCECMCAMYPAMDRHLIHCILLSYFQCFWDRLQVCCKSDQDKAVTKDE